MEIMEIESLEEVHAEKSKDQEIEQNPWDKKSALPFPHPMTRKTVAHGRKRGKQTKEATTEDHALPVCYLVCERHGDQGDPGYQVTDVEEKETAQKRICGSENPGRLLAGPDGPECRAEIPDGLHAGRHPPLV